MRTAPGPLSVTTGRYSAPSGRGASNRSTVNPALSKVAGKSRPGAVITQVFVTGSKRRPGISLIHSTSF